MRGWSPVPSELTSWYDTTDSMVNRVLLECSSDTCRDVASVLLSEWRTATMKQRLFLDYWIYKLKTK